MLREEELLSPICENPVAETSQPEPIPRFQLDKPEVITEKESGQYSIIIWGVLLSPNS